MSWKFWQGRKNNNESVYKQLNEQLTQLGEELSKVSAQITGSNEQAAELGGQVNKLTRLQYKTGQDMHGKLDKLMTGLDTLQSRHSAYDINITQLKTLERQLDSLTGALIRWIDDIDLVCAQLLSTEQEAWLQLMNQWSGQLLTALAGAGIHELDLKGRSFDPRLAESIGTVKLDPAPTEIRGVENHQSPVPYEVVEVVKRGFVCSDGHLLRKAQVLTLQLQEDQ